MSSAYSPQVYWPVGLCMHHSCLAGSGRWPCYHHHAPQHVLMTAVAPCTHAGSSVQPAQQHTRLSRLCAEGRSALCTSRNRPHLGQQKTNLLDLAHRAMGDRGGQSAGGGRADPRSCAAGRGRGHLRRRPASCPALPRLSWPRQQQCRQEVSPVLTLGLRPAPAQGSEAHPSCKAGCQVLPLGQQALPGQGRPNAFHKSRPCGCHRHRLSWHVLVFQCLHSLGPPASAQVWPLLPV